MLELARGLIATANLQEQTGDKAGALAALEEARGLVEAPVAPGPLADESRAALGLSLRRSADLLWSQGNRVDANARLERARTIFESLAEANPTLISHQIDLAVCHTMMGAWLGSNNPTHPEVAVAAKERALAIRQQLADAHPEDADLQAGLAEDLRTTARELTTLGRMNEAMKLLERSRAAWKRLANANPAVIRFQTQEARVLTTMGNALLGSSKTADALPVYREALSRFEKLTAAHPDEVQLQVSFGYAHNNLGGALEDVGRLAEALDELGRAAAVFQTLADAHPDEPDYRIDQIFRQSHMATILRKLGRPAEALKLDQASLDMAQRLGESNPQPALLPSVLRGLALSFDQLGDTAAAVGAARRAVGLADKLGRNSAINCLVSAWSHAVSWSVYGRAGSGVSEVDREIEASTTVAMFRHALELGVKNFSTDKLPESFQKREDFRLFLMDVRMPVDAFVRP